MMFVLAVIVVVVKPLVIFMILGVAGAGAAAGVFKRPGVGGCQV